MCKNPDSKPLAQIGKPNQYGVVLDDLVLRVPGPTVEEIKAHAENINMLFAWAAENGIEFREEFEAKLRCRFELKVKPHGVLDLYNMVITAKPEKMLHKAINNLAATTTSNYLDATNTLLLAAFALGNQLPAGELDAPD